MRVVSDTAASAATDGEAGTEPVRERSHTYHYTITESGSVVGVTNDAQSSRVVNIKVTDDLSWQAHRRVSTRTAASSMARPFTFTNSYSVTPTTSSVTDQMSPQDPDLGGALDANEFV